MREAPVFLDRISGLRVADLEKAVSKIIQFRDPYFRWSEDSLVSVICRDDGGIPFPSLGSAGQPGGFLSGSIGPEGIQLLFDGFFRCRVGGGDVAGADHPLHHIRDADARTEKRDLIVRGI